MTQVHVPPAGQLDRLPKEVSTAAAEVASLREKHLKARRDLVELEHARDRAKMADTDAAATAIREGTKAPAAKLPRAESAIDKARPQVDALALAAERAEGDLAQAVADCAGERSESLRAEAVEQIVAAKGIAEQLVATLDDIESSKRLAAWLEDPSRWVGAFRIANLAVTRPNGEQVDVQTAAAELVAAFAPPEPTNPAQHHRRDQWPAMGVAAQ